MRMTVVGPAMAAVALAACGSSAKTPSVPVSTASGASFDSCSVVTRADVASAVGHVVSAGVPGSATVERGRACVFFGPRAPRPHDPNVVQPDSVRVVVVKGADAAGLYRDYESRVRARPIRGYGDRAFYDGYASLNVLRGGGYVRVAVVPAGGGASLPGEQKLAAAILRAVK